MIYLLSALIAIQVLHFFLHYRFLSEGRKKTRANEVFMGNLHQWVVSNDKVVLQNLEKINELMHSQYIRIRAIDLMLHNQGTGGHPGHSQELRELESILGKEQWSNNIVNEATHREAIEKIRTEDIHYYYSTLIEELQQLNRQIGRGNARPDLLSGAGNSSVRTDNIAPVNGYFNRLNRKG